MEPLGTHGRAIEWAYARPTTPPPSCQIGAGRGGFVRIVSFWGCSQKVRDSQNISRARLINHFLALKWCHGQSYSFRQSPKWAIEYNIQYVWLLIGLIAIVMITLSIKMHSRPACLFLANKFNSQNSFFLFPFADTSDPVSAIQLLHEWDLSPHYLQCLFSRLVVG